MLHGTEQRTGSGPLAGARVQCRPGRKRGSVLLQVNLVQCPNLSWCGYPEDTEPSARNFVPGLEDGSPPGEMPGAGGGDASPGSNAAGGGSGSDSASSSEPGSASPGAGSAAAQAAPVSSLDPGRGSQEAGQAVGPHFWERIAQEAQACIEQLQRGALQQDALPVTQLLMAMDGADGSPWTSAGLSTEAAAVGRHAVSRQAASSSSRQKASRQGTAATAGSDRTDQAGCESAAAGSTAVDELNRVRLSASGVHGALLQKDGVRRFSAQVTSAATAPAAVPTKADSAALVVRSPVGSTPAGPATSPSPAPGQTAATLLNMHLQRLSVSGSRMYRGRPPAAARLDAARPVAIQQAAAAATAAAAEPAETMRGAGQQALKAPAEQAAPTAPSGGTAASLINALPPVAVHQGLLDAVQPGLLAKLGLAGSSPAVGNGRAGNEAAAARQAAGVQEEATVLTSREAKQINALGPLSLHNCTTSAAAAVESAKAALSGSVVDPSTLRKKGAHRIIACWCSIYAAVLIRLLSLIRAPYFLCPCRRVSGAALGQDTRPDRSSARRPRQQHSPTGCGSAAGKRGGQREWAHSGGASGQGGAAGAQRGSALCRTRGAGCCGQAWQRAQAPPPAPRLLHGNRRARLHASSSRSLRRKK